MKILCTGKLALIFWFSALSSVASANCTFPSYAHRDELANPAHIEHIGVEIKKSRKWFKNSLSILKSESNAIDARYKKKYRATVNVRYSFGTCSYPARVRQNGDWKDHIKLIAGGNVISSLDVRLDAGNILNAVRFKLLIPETRFGNNEIFGTYLLQELGFIAPETFLVSADVNGVHLPLLFQENAEKELLERRLRREGPIFEGDESLLWDIEGGDKFRLEDISLSRQTNRKWAEKGETSTQISLNAFERLQSAYMVIAGKVAEAGHGFTVGVAPNTRKDQTGFEDYGLVLLAVRGDHALRPHNLKFYFNSFTQAFEPIYYDGNIAVLHGSWLEQNNPDFGELFTFLLQNGSPEVIARIIDQIEMLKADPEFRQGLLDRAGTDRASTEALLDAALPMVNERLRDFHKQMIKNRNAGGQKAPADMTAVREGLIKRTKRHGVDIQYFQIEGKTAEGSYIARTVGQDAVSDTFELAPEALIQAMNNNRIGDNRATLLAIPTDAPENVIKTKDFLEGEIVLSEGADADVDLSERTIAVSQTSPTDWVLIRGVNLRDWTVTFEGAAQDATLSGGQRFNEFGLTGCLNFYDVSFENVRISGRNGQCEDSVNIVSSTGSLAELYVTDGFADAIDIDFARIEIEELRVEGTGNDCFDVSTGTFLIGQAVLRDCGDKGISVGENSRLSAMQVEVTDAVIGVSSKDFSRADIENFAGSNIEICAEAYQKKQEFGGGALRIDAYDCAGAVNQDAVSSIVLNDLTQ